MTKEFNLTSFIYPVTIIKDRYDGTYSGGAWTAWKLQVWEIPQEQSSNDVECANFWLEYKEIVGKGITPNEAYINLREKLNNPDT